ncbi:MAG: DNA translocase FtsK, partial [Alphaproteobacteria bacterium]
MTLKKPWASADSGAEPLTADEFNLWCAINGWSYRLTRHAWPDGRIEWDIESDPGTPTQTTAYGTGQQDERVAAAMAFAFLAGIEWEGAQQRAEDDTPDDEGDDRDEDEEDSDEDEDDDRDEDEEDSDEDEDDDLDEEEEDSDEDEDDDPDEEEEDPDEDEDDDDDEEEGESDDADGPVQIVEKVPSVRVVPSSAHVIEAPAPGGGSARVGRSRDKIEEKKPAGPYVPPTLDLLQEPPQRADQEADEAELANNARTLETVLRNFKVRGEIMEVKPGPVVTLYEFEPMPGTKSSTVTNLSDDIARSMSAVTARIAVVPGRSVIGIELPNATREVVYLKEILAAQAFTDNQAKLPLALGKDIGGEPVVADLAKMPHLLIAGTTGSGKSVGINAIILSLLFRLPPDRCRLIMIDPKMLELSVYDGIPHLLTPVVTDPNKAVVALKWAVREMESRYKLMSAVGVRNIEGFNARINEALEKNETITRPVQVGYDRDAREPIYEDRPIDLKPLPYIVIVVDEMADLMLIAGKDLEAAVQRLAQMARAAGIHLVMATQRPS